MSILLYQASSTTRRSLEVVGTWYPLLHAPWDVKLNDCWTLHGCLFVQKRRNYYSATTRNHTNLSTNYIKLITPIFCPDMVGRGAEAASEDEPRFRIRVCMRRYFADERARCLLLVGARRRVRWLARRLQALFPLPPRVALLCRGHLLPRGEPLALLDPDDLVEVVPRRAVRESVGIADAPEDAEGDCVDSRVAATDEERADIEDGEEGKAGTEDAVESVDRDSEMAYVPPSPADEPDEPDELHDSKRRALAALERYCVSIPTAAVSAPPRARRRRVRRRRRPMAWEPHAPSPDLLGEPGAEGGPGPGGERLGAEGERLGAEGERPGAEGERLGAEGERLGAEGEKPGVGVERPRAPRVVRALPAGTPPTCDNDIDVNFRCDNGF